MVRFQCSAAKISRISAAGPLILTG
eukprot:COSAG01_NODE_52959_length_342_cov_2.296296_1_plen_24_part_10